MRWPPGSTAGAMIPADRPAPGIIERDLVSEPLETGVLVVDSLFAIGRGQRELIVGDRATGKTSLAVDAICNQKGRGVICVYVAVGQRTSAVERVIAAVRAHGDPEQCIFVVGAAAAAPGLQWIAPFAGMAMAEHFRDSGRDALIVIDDLTRHAATHRELALLTREPPGREAYPGDVFYLHARLLERAAKLSPELGGGSLTALPIAETDAGNLSAYIPTNLISITDGQIVLSTHLFSAGQRPAVDVGLSVSRVGGKAQTPALRAVSGRVRLDYAQFQELEMFTRFGGLTSPRVRAQIARGERIRALLTQPGTRGRALSGRSRACRLGGGRDARGGARLCRPRGGGTDRRADPADREAQGAGLRRAGRADRGQPVAPDRLLQHACARNAGRDRPPAARPPGLRPPARRADPQDL
ncbi:F0F1 ATP synthase subunit alpha [Mangrovicoccus ximenensis]|uniref:F0F1 ATP synthase subunit alpha n=1 Tax=Mangrovicoccus ximenensis TaxID=1911570 RepID=UPI002ED3264D